MNPSDELTDKEQLFVDEYCKCWNRAEAIINAGFNPGNRQRASEMGYQILQKTPVREAIKLRLEDSAMSAHEVLMRLGDMARASLADFSKVTELKDLKNHPKAHVVKKLKVTKTILLGDVEKITTEIELYDAKSALDTLAKHHGLLADKQEQGIQGNQLSEMPDDELDKEIEQLSDTSNGND